ncbi:GntR family transcriptional regulator [Allokutzneria albata]|uniref:DNA-binding transcriptional regulator, GntR family n=1 Tax=Allokutzneria albata TaxID=211114 RepID=A0A1G9WH12_ALLAB|nr:GntR family transcriptional regulator [Allokutzneria albata]SDM83852.1 DNA-binding transcriptional regulator, GntR family [Allokutzneria albata]
MNASLSLEADRALLGRISTADKVAEILRTRIIEGAFQPGERLAEDKIVKALNISRNTLREAFRLLTHARLLTHEMNRGVFVRSLTADDVRDLYRVRRMLECSVVGAITAPPAGLAQVEAAVTEGERAERAGQWRELGTANMHFHQALIGLAGSPRLDEMMQQIIAELRLAFHVMNDPKRFHAPYLSRNQQILADLREGDGPSAVEKLADYLTVAENQLLTGFATHAKDLS